MGAAVLKVSQNNMFGSHASVLLYCCLYTSRLYYNQSYGGCHLGILSPSPDGSKEYIDDEFAGSAVLYDLKTGRTF